MRKHVNTAMCFESLYLCNPHSVAPLKNNFNLFTMIHDVLTVKTESPAYVIFSTQSCITVTSLILTAGTV